MQRFIKKRLSTMGLCFKGNTYHFDNIPKKLYFTSVDVKSILNPSSTHEDSKYVNMFRQILVGDVPFIVKIGGGFRERVSELL